MEKLQSVPQTMNDTNTTKFTVLDNCYFPLLYNNNNIDQNNDC